GTATAGADYTTASGTLTWAAGNTNSQTFSIPLLDDSLVEGDETVILTLSDPVGAVLGAPADSVLIIRDNDVAHFICLPVILK
ncbi:MAG TPA: Calx-beta domain-containing protein, partial [Anaerolineaceae bacterium]|nr:Calx-beta domain-containing protein [Anaerolineaceae bacterium]